MITLQDIKQNEDIKAMIRAGNRYLEALGYTDHGPRHVSYVSRTASGILKALGYSPREVELAAIAGWVHDVGNSVNRHNHGPNGAIMLLPILKDAGMEMNDVMEIITAVGNHEEQSGTISSAVSAALRAEPALTSSSMMIVSKSSIDYSSILRALSRTASPFIMP